MLICVWNGVCWQWQPTIDSTWEGEWAFVTVAWLKFQVTWFSGPLAREFCQRFNAGEAPEGPAPHLDRLARNWAAN